jgi:hypothetical protein
MKIMNCEKVGVDKEVAVSYFIVGQLSWHSRRETETFEDGRNLSTIRTGCVPSTN